MSHATKMRDMQTRAEVAEKTIKWLLGLIGVLTVLLLFVAASRGV